MSTSRTTKAELKIKAELRRGSSKLHHVISHTCGRVGEFSRFSFLVSEGASRSLPRLFNQNSIMADSQERLVSDEY